MNAAARGNVARFLVEAARRTPDACSVIAPGPGGWERVTFRELHERSDALAHGLLQAGFVPGEPALVMVKAGVPLITLTWALFKAGLPPVLIDPGMGLRGFLRCVERTAATAFVGIPLAHALRVLARRPFRTIRRHATAGARWFWGGPTLDELARAGAGRGPFPLADTATDDLAAVLFTSGSTGPAKGTLYTHGQFMAQVDLLLAAYGFRPGEVDLAAFPLFSLFDAALGMTTVVPELDPSRPGTCDPAKVVEAIRTHRCTTAFGSPAIWRRVAPHCIERGIRLDTLRRVLIAGASVPPTLIEQLHRVLPAAGDVFTPYGATEALPVASIAGREVAGETAARTREGAGTCVGRPVPGIDARVIAIDDGPIASWSEARPLAPGEVGEICVSGPVVTGGYHNLPGPTALAKIADGATVWHRMGDLGYLDEAGRLWFCGRKAERVETARGTIFTDRVEGVASAVPGVGRCALVGAGERGAQRAVLVVEGRQDRDLAAALREKLPMLEAVLFHPRLPVDVRHNAKIHRLELGRWAASQLAR